MRFVRWLRAHWRALPRPRQGLVAAGVAALVLVALSRPTLAWLSPRLSVAADSAAFRSTSATLDRGDGSMVSYDTEHADPWGTPIIRRTQAHVTKAPPPPARFYSAGPNRQDERGEGDDVVPTPEERSTGARIVGTFAGLASLGLLLLFWGLSRTVWRLRDRGPKRELLRAGTMALPHALFLPATVLGLVAGTRDATAIVEQLSRLGWGLPQVVATGLLTCWVGCLAWRLNRPTPAEAAEAQGDEGSASAGADA